MNYFAGLMRRLSGKDRAWWDLFSVSFDETGVVVTERKLHGESEVSFVAWEDIRYVCFVDGGLGSDVFRLYTSGDPDCVPTVVPTEANGGKPIWDQLKLLGMFPEHLSGQAVQSSDAGRLIWWPQAP